MIRFCMISILMVSHLIANAQSDTVNAEVNKAQYNASLYYYSFPDAEGNLIPIVYADFNSIHLEGRYNYEDKKSASVFCGYTIERGKRVEFGITPMVGIVFGSTNGIAPGLELEIAWNKIDFYSESEWLFDFESADYNYIYTWTELAYNPNEVIRTGLSANRSRIYQNKKEIQRGIFAEYNFSKFTTGFHYFNPFEDDYYLIGILSYEF
jgi:hypothetical protein